MSTFSNFGSTSRKINQNNHFEIENAASDSISKIAFCPVDNYLASSCWDGTVRCWKIEGNQTSLMASPALEYKHSAPALCCAVTHDGKVISGGCDNLAKMKPLPASNMGGSSVNEIDFGKHDAPIKEIFCSKNYNFILTGSWDKTIKYWDLRSTNMNPLGALNLPERVYSMDVKEHLAVVACAPKTIVGIDLRNPSNILFTKTQENLKYQLRTISIFKDLSGYALGSIEGRCAIEPFNSKNFAFRCHREDNIYPVHSISFHPIYGTFCTSGGDGKFHFWDKDSRHRLVQFKDCGAPVVSTCFNQDGKLFAYATSYDFACGPEPQYFNKSFGGHIYIHRPLDSEILQKNQRPPNFQ